MIQARHDECSGRALATSTAHITCPLPRLPCRNIYNALILYIHYAYIVYLDIAADVLMVLFSKIGMTHPAQDGFSNPWRYVE